MQDFEGQIRTLAGGTTLSMLPSVIITGMLAALSGASVGGEMLDVWRRRLLWIAAAAFALFGFPAFSLPDWAVVRRDLRGRR